ncbi:MAG: response regulator [Elusimicrobia bacterium]|nr:response regulator [Elusimicrobiota bacterium]
MSTILIIDDDKDYRTFLDTHLAKLGFIVFCADSGEQGREFSKNIRPDLILLDLCLKKGFPGKETLRIFKSRPATKSLSQYQSNLI